MRTFFTHLTATLTLCLSGCASAEFRALQGLSPGTSEEEINIAVSNVRPQLLRYAQPLRFYDRYRLGSETLMNYGHSIALLENDRLVFVQQVTKERPPLHFEVTSTVAVWKPEATVFLEVTGSNDELLTRKFKSIIERIFNYRQIAIASSKKDANQIVSISMGRSVSHQKRSVTTPVYSYVYNPPTSSKSTISSRSGAVLGTIDTQAGGGLGTTGGRRDASLD
ncbi:MAG: hypothetical protein IPJ84_01860 [Bdellovibrionales bacterium]|nr:hypothetical protein [Bdellovibrionales bacterium]